jgi:hypothetical protein
LSIQNVEVNRQLGTYASVSNAISNAVSNASKSGRFDTMFGELEMQ